MEGIEFKGVAGIRSIPMEDISDLADSILNGVDYDIYIEDLEERVLLGSIEAEVVDLLSSYQINVIVKE